MCYPKQQTSLVGLGGGLADTAFALAPSGSRMRAACPALADRFLLVVFSSWRCHGGIFRTPAPGGMVLGGGPGGSGGLVGVGSQGFGSTAVVGGRSEVAAGGLADAA